MLKNQCDLLKLILRLHIKTVTHTLKKKKKKKRLDIKTSSVGYSKKLWLHSIVQNHILQYTPIYQKIRVYILKMYTWISKNSMRTS